jgi:5-hydroxyisourate hydrolase-like protein (transthyretin family)
MKLSQYTNEINDMEIALEKLMKESKEDIEMAKVNNDDDLKDILMKRSIDYEGRYDFSEEMVEELMR